MLVECRLITRTLLSLYVVVLILMLLITTSDSCFPGGRLIRRMPKKEPPLIYKEHVPNVPENAVTASGPREGRIKRHDRRFKELVSNHNPDILFKDEESTGADRIMSLRCKEKLDALSMLVMNYWPGVKLRVIDAWEEENGFDVAEALHFEGRAVDLTTSDRDRAKYGMLARLASQAGFDWVYYEHKGHIHASVKSDTLTRHKRTLRCFPANSTIVTKRGVVKQLHELQTGEKILSVDKNGRPTYSDVITFLHVDKTTNSYEFLRICTSNNTCLTVSGDHLLYKMDGNNNFVHVFAERVKIGDFILVYKNVVFVAETVSSVEEVISMGLYAPLTVEGTVVVDGVASSCYAGVRSVSLAHGSLAPLRFLYGVQNYLLSSYSSIFNTRPSTSNDDYVHWYANLLWWLAESIDKFKIYSILDG